MPTKYKIGDPIKFSHTGKEDDCIHCIVMEVDEEGYIVKLRARVNDESLFNKGFFWEDPYWVVINYCFSDN